MNKFQLSKRQRIKDQFASRFRTRAHQDVDVLTVLDFQITYSRRETLGFISDVFSPSTNAMDEGGTSAMTIRTGTSDLKIRPSAES